MKKFFVICLSVVMLFSTLLLCGFASPSSLNSSQKLSVISRDDILVKDIYFDTSLEFSDYYSTLLEIDYFMFNENGYVYPIFMFSDNQFLLIITDSDRFAFMCYLATFDNGEAVLGERLFVVTSGDANFSVDKISLNAYGLSSFNFNGVVIPVGQQNDIISNFIYVDEYIAKPIFDKPFLAVFSQVFIEYIPLLAVGILNMFTGIFWQYGAFTLLGNALITLIGISLVSSIFYVVYRIFKGKIKKRL